MMFGAIRFDFKAICTAFEKTRLFFLFLEDSPEDSFRAKSELLQLMDKDGDGTLSKSEFKKMMKQLYEVSGNSDSESDPEDDPAEILKMIEKGFKEIDTDGNGVINLKELVDSVNVKESLDSDHSD